MQITFDYGTDTPTAETWIIHAEFLPAEPAVFSGPRCCPESPASVEVFNATRDDETLSAAGFCARFDVTMDALAELVFEEVRRVSEIEADRFEAEREDDRYHGWSMADAWAA